MWHNDGMIFKFLQKEKHFLYVQNTLPLKYLSSFKKSNQMSNMHLISKKLQF